MKKKLHGEWKLSWKIDSYLRTKKRIWKIQRYIDLKVKKNVMVTSTLHSSYLATKTVLRRLQRYIDSYLKNKKCVMETSTLHR